MVLAPLCVFESFGDDNGGISCVRIWRVIVGSGLLWDLVMIREIQNIFPALSFRANVENGKLKKND